MGVLPKIGAIETDEIPRRFLFKLIQTCGTAPLLWTAIHQGSVDLSQRVMDVLFLWGNASDGLSWMD
jgi:hypothetical protein